MVMTSDAGYAWVNLAFLRMYRANLAVERLVSLYCVPVCCVLCAVCLCAAVLCACVPLYCLLSSWYALLHCCTFKTYLTPHALLYLQQLTLMLTPPAA